MGLVVCVTVLGSDGGGDTIELDDGRTPDFGGGVSSDDVDELMDELMDEPGGLGDC